MRMPEIQEHPSTESVFVARQPVFRADRSVWGYELLFRASGDATGAMITDSNMATIKVIADGFVLASSGVSDEKRFLVNFPRELILDGSAHALPADRCVVEILEDVMPTPEVLQAVDNLRKSGFTLAMDDFMGEDELMPFLDHVDIIKVDILGLGSARQAIEPLAAILAKYGCKLLAEKVEDAETFEMTKELGFTLFQGYFFSKPEIIPGKKISANQITKLSLMQELGNPDFNITELSRIIQSDTALSYRLFKYINSAGMGVKSKVESVSRALALLGQRQVSQWLRAAIISDISPSKKAEQFALMSIHRARFLELLGTASGNKRGSSEQLFLLGLFSLLDGMLDMPMDEILADLPIDPVVNSALTKSGGPLNMCLDLVRAYETSEWESLPDLLPSPATPLEDVDALYMDAMRWAQHIFSCGKEECEST